MEKMKNHQMKQKKITKKMKQLKINHFNKMMIWIYLILEMKIEIIDF